MSTADASPAPDAGRPPGLRALAGLLQGVPGLVLVTAGLAAGFALILATLLSMAAAIAGVEGAAGGTFAAGLGLLSGQRAVTVGRLDMAGGGGSVQAAVQVVPFGIVTLAAFTLTRIGYTRAWLEVPRGRWLPPLAGLLAAFVVAMIAALAALPAGFDLGFFAASQQVRLSLIGLLAVGAGPWLLALLAVRWPLIRNLLVGILVLQGVLLAFAVVNAGMLSSVDAGLSGAETFAVVLTAAVAALAYGTNLLIVVVWLPFLGAVGYGGTVGSLLALGGGSNRIGFPVLVEEVSPLLWLIPVLVVLGLAVAAWLQPPVRTRGELFAQVRRAALGLSALLLPVLWFGRISLEVSGTVSRELLTLSEELGLLGPLTPESGAIDVTVGAATMPLRFLPALLIFTLVVAVVVLLAAQASGATWAAPGQVGAEARTRGRSLAQRAREAAQAAQAAAEQQQPGDAASGAVPAPVPVDPALADAPPPLPADAAGPEPDTPGHAAPGHAAPGHGAGDQHEPDGLDDDGRWLQAPPPDPSQRRD